MAPDVIHAVAADLYHRLNVRSLDDITTKRVRESLRHLRLRRAYDHVAQITHRLTGRKPTRITPNIEEQLKNMFLQMQPAFQRHAPRSRTNFLSYSYVLTGAFKFWDIPEMLSGITLLKGRDKLEANDAVSSAKCASTLVAVRPPPRVRNRRLTTSQPNVKGRAVPRRPPVLPQSLEMAVTPGTLVGPEVVPLLEVRVVVAQLENLRVPGRLGQNGRRGHTRDAPVRRPAAVGTGPPLPSAPTDGRWCRPPADTSESVRRDARSRRARVRTPTDAPAIPISSISVQVLPETVVTGLQEDGPEVVAFALGQLASRSTRPRRPSGRPPPPTGIPIQDPRPPRPVRPPPWFGTSTPRADVH